MNLINWQHLNEITGGDTEFQAELFQEFVDQMPDMIRQLQFALESGDSTTLGHVAHTIKGSARSIGAEPFAESAHSLEQIGKAGDLSHASNALQTLEQHWDALHAYLQNLLRQNAASREVATEP